MNGDGCVVSAGICTGFVGVIAALFASGAVVIANGALVGDIAGMPNYVSSAFLQFEQEAYHLCPSMAVVYSS